MKSEDEEKGCWGDRFIYKKGLQIRDFIKSGLMNP